MQTQSLETSFWEYRVSGLVTRSKKYKTRRFFRQSGLLLTPPSCQQRDWHFWSWHMAPETRPLGRYSSQKRLPPSFMYTATFNIYALTHFRYNQNSSTFRRTRPFAAICRKKKKSSSGESSRMRAFRSFFHFFNLVIVKRVFGNFIGCIFRFSSLVYRKFPEVARAREALKQKWRGHVRTNICEETNRGKYTFFISEPLLIVK